MDAFNLFKIMLIYCQLGPSLDAKIRITIPTPAKETILKMACRDGVLPRRLVLSFSGSPPVCIHFMSIIYSVLICGFHQSFG